VLGCMPTHSASQLIVTCSGSEDAVIGKSPSSQWAGHI
jgi:hypothetical protein